MKQCNEKKGPKILEYAHRDFETWREQRRKGDRIPEALWASAAQAAKEHGVSRVSETLGLDYYKLKEQSGLDEQAKQCPPETNVAFAELPKPDMKATVVCVVELEKGNGVRMRISLAERALVDWDSLTETFLKA